MKKITAIIILIFFGFIASYLIHWLAGFIAGFVILWIGRYKRNSWWMGLVSFAVMWGGYALFLNTVNQGILSEQIGELFGGVSPIGLILLTALLGGAGGSLIGWTASTVPARSK